MHNRAKTQFWQSQRADCHIAPRPAPRRPGAPAPRRPDAPAPRRPGTLSGKRREGGARPPGRAPAPGAGSPVVARARARARAKSETCSAESLEGLQGLSNGEEIGENGGGLAEISSPED